MYFRMLAEQGSPSKIICSLDNDLVILSLLFYLLITVLRHIAFRKCDFTFYSIRFPYCINKIINFFLKGNTLHNSMNVTSYTTWQNSDLLRKCLYVLKVVKFTLSKYVLIVFFYFFYYFFCFRIFIIIIYIMPLSCTQVMQPPFKHS